MKDRAALTIWTTPERLAAFDAIAKANGMKRSALARLLLNAGRDQLLEKGRLKLP